MREWPSRRSVRSLESARPSRPPTAQHPNGLEHWAEAVPLGDTVLREEVVLEHTSDGQGDLLVLAKSRLADKLDNFGQLTLLLQDFLGLGSQVVETGLCAVVVGSKDVEVLGVGQVPVNRWEVLALHVSLAIHFTYLSQGLGKTPEDLHDTKSRRGNGVRHITTRRRDTVVSAFRP